MLKENVENILDGDKITNKRIKNGREHDDNDKDMIDRLIRRYAWITNLIYGRLNGNRPNVGVESYFVVNLMEKPKLS